MSLVMRTCVANTRPGDFARLEHALHGKKCYCYVISKQNGLAGTLVTDEAYPQRVAINLVDKILARALCCDSVTVIMLHISQALWKAAHSLAD